MKKLTTEQRVTVLKCLVEGNNIRATCHMTGVSKIIVLRLLADIGQFCMDYHNVYGSQTADQAHPDGRAMGYSGCKEQGRKTGTDGIGSVSTWVSMDTQSKVVISYRVGRPQPRYCQRLCAGREAPGRWGEGYRRTPTDLWKRRWERLPR